MATIKLKYRPYAMADKEGSLYFQVIHKRTVRQISINKRIKQSEWDETQGKIRIDGIQYSRNSVLNHMAEELQWQQDYLYSIMFWMTLP